MAQQDPAPIGEWGRIRSARVLLRTLITVSAALAFLQPISATSYLSGNYSALNLHYVNAFFATGATLLSAIAGWFTWRRGGGAGWPAASCAGLFVAECIQGVLGYDLILAVHIVTGSLIVTVYAVLLFRVWRPAPKTERTPSRPGGSAAWR
jgi:hypothetical protein